jgi:hypothetical protein
MHSPQPTLAEPAVRNTPRHRLRDSRFLIRAAFFVVCTIFLALLSSSARILVVVVAAFVGCLGLGLGVLRLFRLDVPTPFREVTGVLLGIGICSLVVQLLSMAAKASPRWLVGTWIALIAVCITSFVLFRGVCSGSWYRGLQGCQCRRGSSGFGQQRNRSREIPRTERCLRKPIGHVAVSGFGIRMRANGTLFGTAGAGDAAGQSYWNAAWNGLLALRKYEGPVSEQDVIFRRFLSAAGGGEVIEIGEILTRRAAVPQSYGRDLLAFPAFAAVAVGAKERSAERSRFPACEQHVRASRSARAV